MLDNCNNAKERWGGVSEIIDRWLKERKNLIVRFCEISGVVDLSKIDKVSEHFQNFCQVLLDYVSAGHFEVYDQLIQEAREFNDGGVELADKIIPSIEKTTEQIVKFNDRFDVTEKCEKGIQLLLDDLSQLGEALEERFELEDVLIEALHNAHADQVA
ncbi:MAG: sigma D regulator [Proteobacteria bacterium]|nr:MAG: sigma D regulator [Pseudomonadota bacterium]